MRLAYVTETLPPDVNGTSVSAECTVRYLRERGHELDLIGPRQRGEAAPRSRDELLAAGWPIASDRWLRCGVDSVAALRRRLREQRAQLVHIATLGPLGRAALAATESLGLPLTTDFRPESRVASGLCRLRGLGWLEPFIGRYLRRLHNRADRTFVPTRALRDRLAANGYEHVEVAGRGVDPLLFWPGRRNAALRAAWGAGDPGQMVMLYVGRLAAEKNVALALRAFDAIRYLQPDTRMVVVGDGPLRGRLQAQFPAAYFAGVQRGEALAQHYASADLFVYPSRNVTSFGNVSLEALASGLALVAFDAGAAAEHVRDGDNGVLVPLDDEEGFVAAAARAAALAEPNSALRRRARESALGAGWDSALSRFEQRLTRLAIDDRPSRQRPKVALARP